MSDAIALVRFPDGELRAAYYFGSIDSVVPVLVPLEEAWDLIEEGMDGVLDRLREREGARPDDVEAVQVWTAYGSGAWWDGQASREAGILVDGFDPYGMAAEMGDPNASPPREVQRGVPDWVGEEWR